MVATRASWLGSREVVEVQFDPQRIDRDKVVERALGNPGWTEITLRETQRAELRPDRDPKYYVSQTALRHVPMSELQAVRCNARVREAGVDAVAKVYLSPRQRAWLARVIAEPQRAWPIAIARPITTAWAALAAFESAK